MPNLFESSDGKIEQLVDSLGNDLYPTILIGGWATWLRVHGEISKDIDMIVPYAYLSQLRERVEDWSENKLHQGKKFRGTINGVHVDIYVPHESQLGARLKLKVEVLAQYTEKIKSWRVLTIDAHLTTKMAALLDRQYSEKGEKDAREIMALIRKGADPKRTIQILAEASTLGRVALTKNVADVFSAIGEQKGLSKADRKWLDATGREWVARARIIAAMPATAESGVQPRAKDVGWAGNRGGYANRSRKDGPQLPAMKQFTDADDDV